MAVTLDQYRQLWTRDSGPPDVFAFAADRELDLSEKLSILLYDQQQRWARHHPLTVEEYLERLPELRENPEVRLQLAVGEFAALRRRGIAPSAAPFADRFRDIREALLEGLKSGKAESIAATDWGTCPNSGTEERSSFPSEESSDEHPNQIGRYRLVRLLGRGSFGRVYLGFDPELHRRVAVKVPTPRRFRCPEDAETYLREARTLAKLDHPHIVPVHDVGRAEGGLIYIVSKFIDGSTLHELISRRRPSFQEAVRLIEAIAQALQHAHEKRLVHRDIKPGNILIEEETSTPYLNDFGLAIDEEAFLNDDAGAGTPAYMSPEQARGEGHRLDGRSDIFSLGVVLYQLLTGSRPFRGSTGHELRHLVITADPIPPRRIDPAVPEELERICLKMLAKRAADRYAAAAELIEDLQHWQQQPHRRPHALQIVPKGLRAFDATDADFFLDLIPGPHDRDGLPESIRFWKTRLEHSDPDETFRVGLIYGPSGCGKSSLTKAGLLPCLAQDVLPIYVEATPEETESRILRLLSKRIPSLSAGTSLTDAFARLRRNPALLGSKRKLVLIIDQFEQWLHAHRGEQNTQMVGALRQCDGGRLQAVVMVRDDFSMAATRFMREIENPIREGDNFAAVDLFDLDHAEQVLLKFGRAFGKLPLRQDEMTDEQTAFVHAVTAGLGQDGKVVPVHLALLSEMIKNKPWDMATLKRVGGAEGIGVSFLEETFGRRGGNPEHRQRRQAARNVLGALLPEVGTDIKGCMRSHLELMAAAELQGAPQEFEQLLRMLDGELRLITPTDPDGAESTTAGDARGKYYQLTHDYLVPALREWLTQKQRETRRGRAQLRLAEHAALWHSRPENRLLPSPLEFLWMRSLTRGDRWNLVERRMMNRAGRVYGARLGLALAFVLVVWASGLAVHRNSVRRQFENQARAGVDRLLVAQFSELPRIVADLKDRQWMEPLLKKIADDEQQSPDARMRACFALADRSKQHALRLIDHADDIDAVSLSAIRDRLASQADSLAPDLWKSARADGASSGQQLRLAGLLAVADPQSPQWRPFAPAVVQGLLVEDTLDVDSWAELLRPVRNELIPPLRGHFEDSSTTPNRRVRAAAALARYADPPLLSELLLSADSATYPVLFPATARSREAVLQASETVLREDQSAAAADPTRQAARRNAAVTLLRLGRAEAVEPVMGIGPDPTARSMFIVGARDFGVPPETLLSAYEQWKDPAARQALLLAITPYPAQEMALLEPRLTGLLEEVLKTDRAQSLRSGAEFLLRARSGGEPFDESRLAPGDAAGTDSPGDRDWQVTSHGQTLVAIPGTSVAVAIHEVTVKQFRRFDPDAEVALDVTGDERCPANKVSFVRAMQYCRWLSEVEEIAEDQMCYPPVSEITAESAMLDPQMLRRTGYRLPTEAEWETACRGGSVTPWFSGTREEELKAFAWFGLTAGQKLHPVGTLRPNAYGLFDMHGNVGEWCHSDVADEPFVLRGGDYDFPSRRLNADARDPQSGTGYSFTGFRIARTLNE